MLFSDVLEGGTTRDGEWSTMVTEDWLQGRSLFGGIQSALGLHGMRALVPSDVPLRVLQTTFVGPVPAGPVVVRSRVLRSGKNVTHVEASLVTGGETAALLIGIFGRARPSGVSVVPPVRAPTAAEREGRGPRAKGAPGVAFAQHFAMHWIRGDLPMSGSRRTDALIEVAMEDRAKAASEEHVVAIADAIPPIALSFLTERAPGSSVTWTLEMLRSGGPPAPLDGWLLHAELTAAGDGYTSQSVVVCDKSGAPVALSRQSMVVFG